MRFRPRRRQEPFGRFPPIRGNVPGGEKKGSPVGFRGIPERLPVSGQVEEFPGAAGIRFAYADLGGKFCSANDTLIMTFAGKTGGDRDSLVQEINCRAGPGQSRVLAVSRGALSLGFQYFDAKDDLALEAAKVKSVQMDLSMQSRKQGKLPVKVRAFHEGATHEFLNAGRRGRQGDSPC